ncbi:MAG: arsenate reductase (thioredoxin) [Gammaproteobacteria bacterium RIFCSPLOWO2_02_FULL_56_15]|nr:MAG: arsenate reductase (thioredoxin) [Gammaproteobacteria bacterium RIFCSPLOWO2_02_FULL_56_15]
MKQHQTRILFLCTGNSCRSQMAEGWTRHLAGDLVEVKSAGIEAHGKNLLAISVMSEVGIDISGQDSTIMSTEILDWADIVVTVCGHADEHCPVLPGNTQKEHWPLEDPAKASGTEDEIKRSFYHTRDEIKGRVQHLIRRLSQVNTISS